MSSSSDRPPRDPGQRLTHRLPQRENYPYAGQGPGAVDPRTGEVWPAEGFTHDPYAHYPAAQTGAESDDRHVTGWEVPATAPVLHDPRTKSGGLESYVPEPPGYQSARVRDAEPLHAPDRRQEALAVPARKGRGRGENAKAPIVPATSVTGRSLTLVIAIMCFLACLTAGAVYMIDQSARAWLRDIASEVTVQIEARDKADVDKRLRDVSVFLAKQRGVRSVKPLSLQESANLLEPWLGSADMLTTMPIPRLIALELNREAPPDLARLRAQLTQQFEGVSLDDHRQWQRQIQTVTRSFALGGFSILLLVAAATIAIIISATRSAMASNKEIVEVLHFVGATDKFIAREFEKHFLRLGIKAGILGAGLAALAFLGLPLMMELLGGGGVTMAELQRLVGGGTLDGFGYVWLAVVVLVVAAICMFTSRLGVKRILHSQD